MNRKDLSTNFVPFQDTVIKSLEKQWYAESTQSTTRKKFIEKADHWFKSTSLNSLSGWEQFDNIDYTLGCAHFIDSTAAKNKWDIQVLPLEYATYKLMGIQQTEIGNLLPEVPLFVTVPNWHFGGLRPEWNNLIEECTEKNIPMHIDFAWFITAKNINIDLNHDCVKSFAMSFSKYGMTWNRCGLRWSKQRTVDSITIENHYYQNTNINTLSAGIHFMNTIPMDYLWNNYTDINEYVCNILDLTPTNIFHVAIDNQTGNRVGIGKILSQLAR